MNATARVGRGGRRSSLLDTPDSKTAPAAPCYGPTSRCIASTSVRETGRHGVPGGWSCTRYTPGARPASSGCAGVAEAGAGDGAAASAGDGAAAGAGDGAVAGAGARIPIGAGAGAGAGAGVGIGTGCGVTGIGAPPSGIGCPGGISCTGSTGATPLSADRGGGGGGSLCGGPSVVVVALRVQAARKVTNAGSVVV